MIKEEYVSFEVAKLLKEKGFPQKYDIYHSMVYNEEDYEDEYEVQRMVLETKLVKAGTLSSYPVGVPEPKCYCPTHQMAMKWLREKHNIYINIQPDFPSDKDYKMCWCWSANILHENCINMKGYRCYIETYEEACEEALKYCLENLI